MKLVKMLPSDRSVDPQRFAHQLGGRPSLQSAKPAYLPAQAAANRRAQRTSKGSIDELQRTRGEPRRTGNAWQPLSDVIEVLGKTGVTEARNARDARNACAGQSSCALVGSGTSCDCADRVSHAARTLGIGRIGPVGQIGWIGNGSQILTASGARSGSPRCRGRWRGSHGGRSDGAAGAPCRRCARRPRSPRPVCPARSNRSGVR